MIISGEPIGSPLVRNPDVFLALNLPSVDKYEYLVPDQGVLVANSSLMNREIERKNIQSLLIPANQIAEELGMARLANMIMVGAMLAIKPILPLERVKKALEDAQNGSQKPREDPQTAQEDDIRLSIDMNTAEGLATLEALISVGLLPRDTITEVIQYQ